MAYVPRSAAPTLTMPPSLGNWGDISNVLDAVGQGGSTASDIIDSFDQDQTYQPPSPQYAPEGDGSLPVDFDYGGGGSVRFGTQQKQEIPWLWIILGVAGAAGVTYMLVK